MHTVRGIRRKLQNKERMGKRLQRERGYCCLFVHNAQDPKVFMSAGNFST